MTRSLFIAPQWIGDAIMSEPLLRSLHMRGEVVTVAALPWVAPVFRAMSAVAAGLIMATALKLAFGQRKRWRWLVFGVLSFVAIGLFRVPLAQTLLVLGPIAVGLAWWREGR